MVDNPAKPDSEVKPGIMISQMQQIGIPCVSRFTRLSSQLELEPTKIRAEMYYYLFEFPALSITIALRDPYPNNFTRLNGVTC